MSGGGGGQSSGNDGTYQANIDNDKRNKAMLDAQAEKQRIAQEFEVNIANALTGAKNTGKQYATSRGLNPDAYAGIIDTIIGDARSKVPLNDPNPGQYFSSDIFDTGFAKEEQARVGGATSKVNRLFAPGFDRALVDDSADDSILNAILGEQRGTAQQQLDFNKKRGVINDIGYNDATAKFGGQEAAARSSLTSIGDAVLGKIRGGLGDIRGEAGQAASMSGLDASSFDPTPYYGRAQKYASDNLADLEGKVRSAVGSTQFFDIPAILASAGTAQGPINLTTSGAKADGTLGFDPKKSKSDRGLGSTGAF
jgi:hypothetical protein